MGWRTGTQHLKGKALLPRLMIMKKINVKSGSYVEMLWNNFLFCFACSIIFPVQKTEQKVNQLLHNYHDHIHVPVFYQRPYRYNAYYD